MIEDLKGLSTSWFGNIADRYPEEFSIVRDNLAKADIRITYRTYTSIVIFMSLLSFVFGVVISLAALSIIEIPLFLKIIYVFFVSVIFSLITFITLVFYPMQRASARKAEIENNLPFLLTHMGAVTESGIPPYVIFRLISQFAEYGEASKEIKKIVRNIDRFGIDPLTAVKNVAEKTPSDELKQVLLGFVTTTEAGGNLRTYLKIAGDQAVFNWRMKREKFLQQLTTYAEFYTGILIAAPLLIIALFAVMNIIQPTMAGYSIFDLMRLSIYILVPVLNIVFLLFLRGIEVPI